MWFLRPDLDYEVAEAGVIPANALLDEDGNPILDEDGNFILTEG